MSDGWPGSRRKETGSLLSPSSGNRKAGLRNKASEPVRQKIPLNLLFVHQIGGKSRVFVYSTCKSICHGGGRIAVVERAPESGVWVPILTPPTLYPVHLRKSELL